MPPRSVEILRPRMRVGDDSADIRGFTNTHIQCAVDRIALLGGGAVELTAGTFAMADSLHMRTGVSVRGQGDTTVLRKNAMKQARVATFLGFGHYDLVVDEPDAFELGDGVLVGDRNAWGFYQSVSTLVRREGDTWFTSRPHPHDYLDTSDGYAKTLFPLVSAVDVHDTALEDLAVDGNADENEPLGGCRGGGVFAHRSDRVAVRRVTVRDFAGEGFSFQTCDDLELADCLAERCSGNGLHPGSGSNRFHIHGCTARRCGQSGLFYCLRVRDGLLEDCTFEHNRLHGVSIGGRDTGHLNRRLTIRHNGGAGVFLREGGRQVAPHYNTIEDCILEHNAAQEDLAEIVLQGQTEGIRLIGNRIRRRPDRPGILVMPEMLPFEQRDNTIEPAGEGAVVKRPASTAEAGDRSCPTGRSAGGRPAGRS